MNKAKPTIPLRLHAKCFESASEGRIAEWKRALQEINQDRGVFSAHDLHLKSSYLEIHARGDLGFTFRLHAEEEIPVNIDIRRRHLQPHFDDYREVIENLLSPQGSAYGTEALDYGKKLVHDEAAEFLCANLRDHLTIEHATARRIFTLLFLLANNVTWAQVRMHPQS